MRAQSAIPVIWDDGLKGQIEDVPALEQGGNVEVLLENGRRVSVAADRLIRLVDGSYRVDQRAANSGETVVVPVILEELEVGRQAIETGRVRITKRVQEHEELIDQPLLQESVEVRRVTVNQRVDTAPAIRHEGDTMIVPIVEEVLVVEKHLFVKEELHITKRRTVQPSEQRVNLRSEEAIVERMDASGQFVAETPAPVEQVSRPEPLEPSVLQRATRTGVRPLRKNKVVT